MEALDTERLRERTELESQVNSLRQTHLDSQVRIMCVASSRVSSGHGSDRSSSPKIVTGPKIMTMVYRTTSNLHVFDQF